MYNLVTSEKWFSFVLLTNLTKLITPAFQVLNQYLYLSDWWLHYNLLKDAVCLYCLEVLVKYGNFLLIVPPWWTDRAEDMLQTRQTAEQSSYVNAGLHEDGVSFHHLCRAVEWKSIESVDKIFVQDVQVFHLLHWSVNERSPVWHCCQGYFHYQSPYYLKVCTSCNNRRTSKWARTTATSIQFNWNTITFQA